MDPALSDALARVRHAAEWQARCVTPFFDQKGDTREEVPALSVDVVEPVGAGDSFAAGYLSGMLFGLGQKASLRRGHVAAACTLTVHGDRGPLPGAGQLAAILDSSDDGWADIHVVDGHFNTRTGA